MTHPTVGKEQPEAGERGITAIWTALVLVLLVAGAGMAIDVGNWTLQVSRQQNAADAASLGGVVFLPGDLTSANDVAVAIANQHGYAPGEVTVVQGAQENQLEVTVQRTVPTAFLSVIGINDRVLTQTATAEFEAPVDMGSPEPTAGNDPESSPPNQPQYWLNSAGPLAPKINGDRYGTRACEGATHGCTGDTNDDYDPEGYIFGVTVSPSMVGRKLSIQVFDGAMYETTNTCASTNFPTPDERNMLGWLTDSIGSTPAGLPAGWYDDAPSRYVDGESIWCTGDQGMNGFADAATSFVFREPDGTPWNNFDNNIVGSCPVVTMPSFDPSLPAFDLLFPEGEALPEDPGAPGPAPAPTPYDEPNPATHGQHVIDAGDGEITFGETFRRWYTMCEVPASAVRAGEYLVQMVTNSGGGHNRLSVRAGAVVGSSFNGSGVNVQAKGRLPISALATDSNTIFSIARVLPGGRNRELVIELYDMGDASNPGTLRILPPTDANITQFRDCGFVRSDGAALPGVDSASCALSGVSNALGFNGRSIVVSVPIPLGYQCDAARTSGCWVRVQAIFAGGVTDTTTWSATMNGDPVRLIK